MEYKSKRFDHIDDRCIYIPHSLIDSPEYRAASNSARAVLIEAFFLSDENNNLSFALSARSMADQCNISKNTAAKAINELISLGFIRRTNDRRFMLLN